MKKVFITTGIIALLGGATTAVLSSSCDTVCTLEAKPSVILQVFAEGSTTPAQVTAKEVWYTVGDATAAPETLRGECLDDECTEWILGYETEGKYEIHATVCGQEYTTEAFVSMTDDGCHVETEWAKIEADVSDCPELTSGTHEPEPGTPPIGTPPPTECTLEARPSIIADVVADKDGRLTPVDPDRVWYFWDGDPGQRQWPGACLNEECSKFAAGREEVGTFRVAAEVCGNVVTESVDVVKTEDGCHVATKQVILEADLTGCAAPPFLTAPEIPACDTVARPSAYVFVVEDGGDVWIPHYTDGLIYHVDEEERGKGVCLDTRTDGKCSSYVVGWERTGRFSVETEACDQKVGTVFTVEMADDDCHVATQYLPLFVNSTGCIAGQATPDGTPPTPPAGPI
jgi:hypothetical protein